MSAVAVDEIGWWVVVPLKDTRIGKSRIAAAPEVRRALAIAMFRDTVAAVLATPSINGIVVVCSDARDARLIDSAHVVPVVKDDRHGVNAAADAGGRLARQLSRDCWLAVLPGDLPALRSDELSAALERAARHRRAFVADAQGSGTTLLTASPGHRLAPRYGPHSRSLHATTGAVELGADGLDSLRRDVDDIESLAEFAQSAQPALGMYTARIIGDTGLHRPLTMSR